MEVSHSGRLDWFAKPAYVSSYREFESLYFRMKIEYVIETGTRSFSPGDTVTRGITIRQDLESAYRFLNLRMQHQDTVVVWWRIKKRVVEEELIAEG